MNVKIQITNWVDVPDSCDEDEALDAAIRKVEADPSEFLRGADWDDLAIERS